MLKSSQLILRGQFLTPAFQMQTLRLLPSSACLALNSVPSCCSSCPASVSRAAGRTHTAVTRCGATGLDTPHHEFHTGESVPGWTSGLGSSWGFTGCCKMSFSWADVAPEQTTTEVRPPAGRELQLQGPREQVALLLCLPRRMAPPLCTHPWGSTNEYTYSQGWYEKQRAVARTN